MSRTSFLIVFRRICPFAKISPCPSIFAYLILWCTLCRRYLMPRYYCMSEPLSGSTKQQRRTTSQQPSVWGAMPAKNAFVEESESKIPDHSHPCLVETHDDTVFPATEYSIHRPSPPLPVRENVTTENGDALFTSKKVIGYSN